MADRTAVVTGASGDIGRRLVPALQARGTKAVFVPSEMDLSVAWEEFHQLLLTHVPKTVYHAAAGRKNLESLEQLSLNSAMAHHICMAIAKLPRDQRPVLVNLSSAAELGVVDDKLDRVDENYFCSPLSAYGRSKLCQTHVVLSLAAEHGFRAICARVFNIVGLGGKKELMFESWARQIREMRREGGALEVGDLDLVRDFITADQLVDFLIRLGEHPTAYGLVNLASGQGILLREAALALRKLSGFDFEIREQKEKFGYNPVRRVVGCTAKLEAILGHSIHFDLKDSLRQLLTT